MLFDSPNSQGNRCALSLHDRMMVGSQLCCEPPLSDHSPGKTWRWNHVDGPDRCPAAGLSDVNTRPRDMKAVEPTSNSALGVSTQCNYEIG